MTARVLVVDDIPTNLRLMEARLSAEYYEVALAASGPEALAMARDWAPEVVLLDVMMPDMDGYEVCRALKADPATAHAAVVMVTALTDRAERVRGLEAGADDFLSKPVDHAALFARLRALLRGKRVADAYRLRAAAALDLGLGDPASEGVGTAAPVGPTGGPDAVEAPPVRALLALPDAREAAELAAALAEEGIACDLAAHGADAWDRMLGERYDLAVLGVWLGDGEGLRLASRMRAHPPTRDVPVLLVGEADEGAHLLRGLDLGTNDHVLRPVDPAELRARARNQLRRHRQMERLRADLDRSLELAVTDSLTGLRNRRYATRHLDGLLREAGAIVMLLDVDRFKAVNDAFGHAGGDVVLRVVAERVRAAVRAVDVVARWGGEEFVVLLPATPPEDADAVAERLRRNVAGTPVALPDRLVGVTVSVGFVAAARGTPPAAALAAADAALYRAKAGGRDRVERAPALSGLDGPQPSQTRGVAT